MTQGRRSCRPTGAKTLDPRGPWHLACVAAFLFVASAVTASACSWSTPSNQLLAWHPNGTAVIFNDHRILRMVDLEKAPPLNVHNLADTVWGRGFHAAVSRTRFAYSTSDNVGAGCDGMEPVLRIFDWKTRKLVKEFEQATGYYRSFTWSSDGRWLGVADAGSGERTLLIDADLHIEKEIAHRGAPSFSPDGERLAIGGVREIVLVAVPSGRIEERIDLGEGAYMISGPHWDPTANDIIVGRGSWRGVEAIEVWDLENGALQRTLHESLSGVSSIDWHSASRRLAVLAVEAREADASEGRGKVTSRLRISAPPDWTVSDTIEVTVGSRAKVKWSPDGASLVVGGAGGQIHRVELSSGTVDLIYEPLPRGPAGGNIMTMPMDAVSARTEADRLPPWFR